MDLSPTYPEPESEKVPFSDPNLKLPVLDALSESGLIQLGSHEELATHVLGRQVDFESDGWELLEPVHDYLLRYPLSQELLDQVEELWFDGGLGIYVYPFFHWDGGSEEFDVGSLGGLEHCPNLKKVCSTSMLKAEDLTPLGGVQSLERLELSLKEGAWKNLSVLLGLQNLNELRYFSTNIEERDQEVLRRLVEKKVVVHPFGERPLKKNWFGWWR